MTSQIVWARCLPLLGLLAVAGACADPHPEGRHSSIHVSTNGGLAWQTVGGPFKGEFAFGLCVTEESALAVSSNAQVLSIEPGRWRRLAERDPATTALHTVWCEGPHVVAGGDRPALHTSHDRGRTWSVVPVSIQPGSWIRSIRRIGRSVVAVGQYGALLRSDDDGRGWSARKVGPRSGLEPHYDLEDVWGTSASDLLLVGGRYGGTLPSSAIALRTRDGGATVVPVPTGTDRKLEAIWSDGRGTVLAVGVGGAIVRSTDGGAAFSAIASGVQSNLHDLWGDGRGTVLAVGDKGTILRSTDSGKTFARIDAGTPHDLDAIAGRRGAIFALGHHPDPPSIPYLLSR